MYLCDTMYKFSSRSLDKLSSAHIDLQKIMLTAIEKSRVDFGISEGYRSLERQQQLFNEGKSRTDPSKGMKGKHNEYPAMAVDFYPYAQGKVRWDDVHTSFVAGVILTVADELYESGDIKHRVRSGADWDSDGLLVIDHTLKDIVHIELI